MNTEQLQNEQDPAPENNFRKELRATLVEMAIVVAVVLFLNTFIGGLVLVDGHSMEPTLLNRDLMIVRKIAYQPETGDIVVIRMDEFSPMGEDNIVKRVIGLEGQEVIIDYENNRVAVDGAVLDEPYLNDAEADTMEPDYGAVSYRVPEGCIFVMGDNRNHSTDSRSEYVGMVPAEQVMGGVILRIPSGRLFK